LKDIQSHPGEGYFEKAWRGQAAYGLSNLIAANPEKIGKSDFPDKVLAAYESSNQASHAGVREFLALTLGHLGSEKAVPALLEGLDDRETGGRINAAWALGAIGNKSAVPGVLKLLRDEEGAVRRTAAYVVGAFAERKGVEGGLAAQASHDLQVLLNDPRDDVRWNAAIALAQLNDPAGADLLMKLLDREYVASLKDVKDDDREALRISAVQLLARLKFDPARARISALGQGDPNLRVREAAIKVLGNW
jgi:HEAT repeat protein